jgi:hypothetical protein
MSQSQPSSAIHSLQTVQGKVKLRLMKVPEYRAFLAIEQPIAEVADILDLVAHLQTAKQKILERLTTTQEYRALLTVEKAIKDISEVLDFVGNDANVDVAPAAAKKAAAKEELPATSSVAAEEQQSVSAIAVGAPPPKAPAVVASLARSIQETPETYARDAAEFAAAIEAAREQPKSSVSNPNERLSTLGVVEEWRLLAHGLDNEETRPAAESKSGARRG